MAAHAFPRDHFIDSRFHYRRGEHVTVLGPTGCGKTTLAYQLLQRVARPTLPAVVMVMKPRDDTVDDWSEKAKFRRVDTWPPPWRPFAERTPPGWVHWPRHSFDPDVDEAAHHGQFRRSILDCYRRGNRILFADEAYSLAAELRLHRELITVWTKGRSMGTALWVASQRPVDIPLYAYSMAEHIFIAKDPDKRARERYAEIGGVDPALVREVVDHLPRHAFLYIKRAGPQMCIVNP